MSSEAVQREALVAAIENVADRIVAEKEHLTDLDSAIGDADHGANMARGFGAVLDKLEGMDGDPDEITKTVGMTLISEVGGAAGPLYGGSCMHASQELEDGITAESSIAFAESFLEKLQDRGDARVGDKTMVDAITPAVHTYKKSIEEDDLPPLQALAKAVDAARRGVDFTVPLRASKGRASYLGWRSVGHQDPGATSTLYMLEEILATAEEHLEEAVDAEGIDAYSPTIPEEDPDE